MSKKYDVIIIGAGIGGLTLGALLTKRGKKVLVIEKNRNVGGYCSNFKRKNFVFDASLHSINGCYSDGSVYEILKKCSIVNKLNFLQPKYLYRAIFPDYDIRFAQNDKNDHIKSLSSIFPEEKESLKEFLKVAIRIFNEIKQLETQGKISKNSIILEYSNKSFQSLLDDFIGNAKLKAILSQYWVYCGIPPSKLSSLYYCYLWSDFVVNGGYYPEGGSQHLCKVILDYIKECKNLVLTNTTATRILTDNNCAIGVVVDDGRIFRAKNVVSNIDVKSTANNLLNSCSLPAHYRNVINNTKVSISAFKVYLGIDKDIKEINNKDYEIFINPSYDLNQQYEDSIKNLASKIPISINIYTNLLRKSQGRSTVSITALSGYDYWKSKSLREYKKKKTEMAEILLERIDDVMPGVIKHIKIMEIATPLTMEKYTGNYHGAIYGWMKEEFRTSLKRINQVTPVKNLYLTSNWTRKGGGISGVMRSSELVDKLLS